MTQNYGPLVRVRHDLLGALLFVEVKQADDTWKQVKRIDEMSNGFAWHDARKVALEARRTLMERENVLPATP